MRCRPAVGGQPHPPDARPPSSPLAARLGCCQAPLLSLSRALGLSRLPMPASLGLYVVVQSPPVGYAGCAVLASRFRPPPLVCRSGIIVGSPCASWECKASGWCDACSERPTMPSGRSRLVKSWRRFSHVFGRKAESAKPHHTISPLLESLARQPHAGLCVPTPASFAVRGSRKASRCAFCPLFRVELLGFSWSDPERVILERPSVRTGDTGPQGLKGYAGLDGESGCLVLDDRRVRIAHPLLPAHRDTRMVSLLHVAGLSNASG